MSGDKKVDLRSASAHLVVDQMISYQPFWNTLKEKNISTYALIYQYNVSSNRLTRMRKGAPLTTTSIDELCRILQCRVEDIMEYVEE